MAKRERRPRIISNRKGQPQISRTRRKLFGRKRKQIFLEHLAATANVEASAKEAQVCASTVYRHRMKDPVFREDWDLALEQGIARLKMLLVQKAEEGAEPLRFRGDKTVAASEKWDSTLAMSLVKNHERGLAGIRRGGGPRPRVASDKETEVAIILLLDKAKRKLGL